MEDSVSKHAAVETRGHEEVRNACRGGKAHERSRKAAFARPWHLSEGPWRTGDGNQRRLVIARNRVGINRAIRRGSELVPDGVESAEKAARWGGIGGFRGGEGSVLVVGERNGGGIDRVGEIVVRRPRHNDWKTDRARTPPSWWR